MLTVISVIIPVYKAEAYLRRCVDSVRNQTYQKLEIILVNDGSPDQSGDICEEYAKKDPRIRVIHKKNGGASSARNAGLDAATGNYISFVDSDDILHPRMLELLMKALIAADAGFAACAVKTADPRTEQNPFSEEVVPEGYESYSADVVFADFNRGFYPKLTAFPHNKLYRRALFADIRFDVDMKIYEDEMICLELIQAARRVAYVPCAMYCYYQTQDSLMRSVWDERMFLTLDSLQHLSDFMQEKGISKEVDILQWKWLQAYLRLHYAVREERQDLLELFGKYEPALRNKYAQLMKNPEVLRAYRWVLRLFQIHPALAKPLFRYLQR